MHFTLITKFKYLLVLLLLFFAFIFENIQLALAVETRLPSSENLRQILLYQGYAEIPLHINQNPQAIIIDIALGDGQQLPFLLDTGSIITMLVINPEKIKKL